MPDEPPPPRSIGQIKARVDAIARQARQIEIEERRAERAFMRAAAKARKADARMKIVLGALVLEAARRNPGLLEMLRSVVSGARPRDQILFRDTILEHPSDSASPPELNASDMPADGQSALEADAQDPVLVSLAERFAAIEAVTAKARQLVEQAREHPHPGPPT